MTASAVADPWCLCGCRKTRHRGRGGCKDCGEFECNRFARDDQRAPETVDLGGESTSAALRRVEAERDEYKAHLDAAVRDAKSWHDTYQEHASAVDELFGQLLALMPGAEHTGADAYDQIPRGIESLANKLRIAEEERVRHASRVAELEQQMAASQGYLQAGDPAAALIHTYPALYCTACYCRFLEDTDAATNHQHPLVPITVTITERPTTR